jgi:hypothetical protein
MTQMDYMSLYPTVMLDPSLLTAANLVPDPTHATAMRRINAVVRAVRPPLPR